MLHMPRMAGAWPGWVVGWWGGGGRRGGEVVRLEAPARDPQDDVGGDPGERPPRVLVVERRDHDGPDPGARPPLAELMHVEQLAQDAPGPRLFPRGDEPVADHPRGGMKRSVFPE